MADWDAIIVGAGPAGSALACRLAPRRRVLLLERTAVPIAAVAPPRIGESLPGAARVLLQRFGLFERFLAAGHAERGATVSHWDDGEPVWFDHLRDPHGPGWHLDRDRFDCDLREAAVSAGATLIDGCGPLHAAHDRDAWRIEQPAGAQIHRAPVLVDATGRNAAIARQLGIPRRVEDELICLHAYLPPRIGDEDDCTRLCADANGWWYSVRVPSGRRVLAFHLDADDVELRALRSLPRLLAKARRQAVLADALLADVGTDSVVHARPAGSALLDSVAWAQAAPGFFAIGDAGLSFDPIASQGLFHALASAECAARAIEVDSGTIGGLAAREALLAEYASIHAHYRRRWLDTYAGPARHRAQPFWMRRSTLAQAPRGEPSAGPARRAGDPVPV